MNEKKTSIKNRLWLKIAAFILAIVSAFCVVFSAAIMFVCFENDITMDEEAFQKAADKELLHGYALRLYEDSDGFTKDLDGLDGGNISYTVEKCNANKGTKETIYTNNPDVTEDNCLAQTAITGGTEVMGSGGTEAGIFDIIKTGAEYSTPSVCEDVKGFVYAKDSGKFYARTDSGNLFLMTDFDSIDPELGDIIYHLNNTAADPYYYEVKEDGTEGSALDKKTIESWIEANRTLFFDSWCAAGFESMGSYQYRIDIEDTVEEPQGRENFNMNSEIRGESESAVISYTRMEETEEYLVFMTVNPEREGQTVLKNGMTDYFQQTEELAHFLYSLMKGSVLWFLLSLAVFAVAFAVLMMTAGRRAGEEEIRLRWTDKIPFAVLTLLAAVLVGASGGLSVLSVAGIFSNTMFQESLLVIGAVLYAGIAIFFALFYCMSIAVRLKTKNFMRYTLLHYLVKPIKSFDRMIRSNVSFFVISGVVMAVVTLLELFVICVAGYDTGVLVGFFIIFKLIEIPLFIYVLNQMNQIQEGGRRVANGDYSNPIDTKRMFWGFKEHAENINNVGDGISRAVEERMKSERFKTELITNVSHDIKTPLTSIINYVDLMKKEEIGNPTVQEYIGILDRQSARLKKLIEDLMEASKASTGNLPVHLEKYDATVMLTQAVGEFQERSQERNLDIVVESPNPPVHIMADGRHLWRVIDNLMSNICKYAQPGTRVYIELERFNGMVIMTFKNVSKERLNITSEELMERFVRGDSSRNTEGNGLGLSIAKSLSDLMGANFAIQIDGDLFKAILSFAECTTEETEKKAEKE